MAILYKAVERGEPGVVGGGKRKYYAQIVYNGETNIDDMVKDIEKFSALSEPDIRGVIIALENVIMNRLADDKVVRMDRLGTFYPRFKSSGEDKPELINQHNISNVSVNYRPGPRILNSMKAAGFKKVKDKEPVASKPVLNTGA